MKQMCGRGKFFMSPGMSSPNGKLRKYDDNRIFFGEGGPFGPPYGSSFPSSDFNITSAYRNQSDLSGNNKWLTIKKINVDKNYHIVIL